MSTQPEEPTWGPPPEQPKRRWTTRRTLAAVGVALGLAAGSGAVVWAASGDDGARGTTQGGPGGQFGPGGAGGGLGMGGMCGPQGSGQGSNGQQGGQVPDGDQAPGGSGSTGQAPDGSGSSGQGTQS